VLPALDHLREQRFRMMVYAKQSWNDWASMTPNQRDDFLYRYHEYGKELEREQQQQALELKQKMEKIRSK
jgi:hypothetical protein